MIELATRIPIQLSPGQAVLVAALAAGAILAVLARSLFEAVLIGALSLILRLTGHPPPDRSSIGIMLDELDRKLEQKKKE